MTRYMYKPLLWLGVGQAYYIPRRATLQLRRLSVSTETEGLYDTVNSVFGRVAILKSELEPGSRVTGIDSGGVATILVSRSPLALGLMDEDSLLIPGEALEWEEDCVARLDDSEIPIFQDGPKQEELQRIDTFLETGVPFIDAVTPIGKGQSCLFVGPTSALKNCREAALRAVQAQSSDDVACIVAQLSDDSLLNNSSVFPTTTTFLKSEKASADADLLLQSQCQALLTTHTALASATKLMRTGRDTLVVIDNLEPLLSLWRQSSVIGEKTFMTTSSIDNTEHENVGADSECRAFFSSILQRSGRLETGGSLAIIALACADPAIPHVNTAADIEIQPDKVYTVADFAGARSSIIARLRALEDRGVVITADVLSKIGLRSPESAASRDITVSSSSARRAEAVEMLTSIADAHVEFLPGTSLRFDPALSLQRVGVGADTGIDPRPELSRKLALGSPLRLFLASVMDQAEGPNDNIDQRQIDRATAWLEALDLPLGKSNHPLDKVGLSRIALIALTVEAGHLDSVPKTQVSDLLYRLYSSVLNDPSCSEACSTIDTTQDLSDSDRALLVSAIDSFFSSSQ